MISDQVWAQMDEGSAFTLPLILTSTVNATCFTSIVNLERKRLGANPAQLHWPVLHGAQPLRNEILSDLNLSRSEPSLVFVATSMQQQWQHVGVTVP